ncbi:MAG TPA: 4-hydroxy-tetrahydrodipicolinate reductase [Bacteroidales bacterium]|nr:4-hydroxy-tetrahydrodipicolinate reductase [Bacteroidales bacterium]HRZ78027.1 4-hydroxy-tetrahydrodipicolinate reductase [Bacteroidales bacterium]
MKLAIIGNGKMGKEVIKAATARQWEITAIIDNALDWEAERPLGDAEVAIEFTTPEAVFDNLRRCFDLGVPVVCGTTGWYHRLEEIQGSCRQQNGGMLYAPNFSKGVNILFALNRYLATIFDKHPEYEVVLSEYHHVHKLDAPSGTAIRLAEAILKLMERKKEWVKGKADHPQQIGIQSYRNGEIPGNHLTLWESEDDSIQIIHQVKHRRVFAIGALDAAAWLRGRKGIYTLEDVLFTE